MKNRNLAHKDDRATPRLLSSSYPYTMKVALLFICINPLYWPYIKDVVEDANKHFLTDHQVDYYLWSDIPELGTKEYRDLLDSVPSEKELSDTVEAVFATEAMARVWTAEMATKVGASKGAGRAWIKALQKEAQIKVDEWVNKVARPQKGGLPIAAANFSKEEITQTVKDVRKLVKNIFPTGPAPWPMPTLMRYNLFLQQEELLKTYDYIFYMDADMRIVDTVGDEVLGDGLTAACHPGYYIRKIVKAPLEPNIESAAYVPSQEFYFAGGFQGGKSDQFIEAMWAMRKTIDRDFQKNYIARWNDESHWNHYLSTHPPAVVLSPAYVYPDSLIKELYEPIIWGEHLVPKIITITKPFTISKEGGDAVKRMTQML